MRLTTDVAFPTVGEVFSSFYDADFSQSTHGLKLDSGDTSVIGMVQYFNVQGQPQAQHIQIRMAFVSLIAAQMARFMWHTRRP